MAAPVEYVVGGGERDWYRNIWISCFLRMRCIINYKVQEREDIRRVPSQIFLLGFQRSTLKASCSVTTRLGSRGRVCHNPTLSTSWVPSWDLGFHEHGWLAHCSWTVLVYPPGRCRVTRQHCRPSQTVSCAWLPLHVGGLALKK